MGYVVRPGDIIKSKLHQYTIIKEINKGGFADAYMAKTEENETVFFKQYKSPSKLVPWFKDYFKYEDELNKRLRNDPVLKSAAVYSNEIFLAKPCKPDGSPWTRNESIFQSFPFIKGNVTMEDMIHMSDSELSWERRVYACTVFAYALRKLHDADVVHCDLKPENVQVKLDPTIAVKYRPLLIDMDWSILSDKTPPWDGYQGYVGTVGYNSPEHLKGKIPLEASDVFTAAIIICQVLAGVHPFYSHLDKDDLTKYVLSGKNDFTNISKIPFKGDVTPMLVTLIKNALDPNPKNRPTMEDIHKELMGMCKQLGKITNTAEVKSKGVSFIKKAASAIAKSSKMPSIGVSKADVPEPVITRPVARPRPVDVSAVSGKDVGTSKITISGDIGKLKTASSFIFDQVVLKNITSQASFADSNFQFSIKPHDGKWFVEANAGAANATTLNGVEITTKTELKDGDKINLMGRKSGKTAMFLNVNM